MATYQEKIGSDAYNELVLNASNNSARADFFPKLVGLQHALGAKGFVVFRAVGAGFVNKRKLTVEIDGCGVGGHHQINQIISELGDVLLDHIERSMLPVVWSNAQGAGIAHMPTLDLLMQKIEIDTLSDAGIALPVRLGTIGNGYIVFIGQNLTLDSEVVLEQHVKACQIIVDLLAIEERRAAPSEALSERELACLQLAGDGRISDEIAVKLGLSVHTVNAYLGAATIKLNSVNRIQAIAKAIRLGYIH